MKKLSKRVHYAIYILLTCVILISCADVKTKTPELIYFTNREGFKPMDVVALSDTVFGVFVLVEQPEIFEYKVGIVTENNGILLFHDYEKAVNRHLQIHNAR